MKKAIPVAVLLLYLAVSQSFSQCGEISMIGEFSNWIEDLYMIRDSVNLELWTQSVTFTDEDDLDLNGYIDMKFREDGDWTVNWGGQDFPHGLAIQNGPVLPVPYGSYHVSFNCESLVYDFTITTGTDEQEINDGKIRIFPNPSSDRLTISYPGVKRTGQDHIKIFNTMGHAVREFHSSAGDKETLLDISDLPPGIYIVRVISDDDVMAGRVVKN